MLITMRSTRYRHGDEMKTERELFEEIERLKVQLAAAPAVHEHYRSEIERLKEQLVDYDTLLDAYRNIQYDIEENKFWRDKAVMLQKKLEAAQAEDNS